MGRDPAKTLRSAITAALRRQGYAIRNGSIELPEDASKADIRRVHGLAVAKKLADAESHFRRHEERYLSFIASGEEVEPTAVAPKLIYVRPKSEAEMLFRYASLHWSIPVSSGYGRRLRFLVMDQSNGKLIGLFGLGDPVFSVRARDEFVGWGAEEKKARLYHLMDAFVLGAVPPYSSLLCGKLVAMLALSNEVRQAFRKKYAGTESLIRGESRPPFLTLLVTTSALGRSSIYNRLRLNGVDYWKSVGFTQGSGDFHFSNGVYHAMRDFVEANCQATAKHPVWGTGFRNKREVIRKCLSEVGLSTDLQYHGVKREVFVALLGRDALRFLRGEVSRPGFFDWKAGDLACMFKERWLLPRAERCPDFRDFRRESYRLWPNMA